LLERAATRRQPATGHGTGFQSKEFMAISLLTVLRLSRVIFTIWVAVKSRQNSFKNCRKFLSEILLRFMCALLIGLTGFIARQSPLI